MRYFIQAFFIALAMWLGFNDGYNLGFRDGQETQIIQKDKDENSKIR